MYGEALLEKTAMKKPTLPQAIRVLELIVEKQTPGDELQKLCESGLFADLLDANIDVVDRDEFRRVLGLAAIDVEPRVAVELSAESPEIFEAEVVIGSDLVITTEDCNRFLRDFVGVKGVDSALFAQAPQPANCLHWPIPDWGQSYEDLQKLLKKQDVSHYWYAKVEAEFDIRQPDAKGRLLWTPAAARAIHASPEFAGVPYRTLWENHKPQILTGREAIILWLLVRFVSKGELLLDSQGWTRTGSRYGGGGGVLVYACGSRLYVNWSNLVNANPFGGARSAVSA